MSDSYKTNDYGISSDLPPSFKTVILSWFKIINEYQEHCDFDCTYLYNELANIGAFNAALAREKITCIQEYNHINGIVTEKREGKTDLSFYYLNQWYLVEAKYKLAKDITKWKQDLNEELISACNDAEESWQGQSLPDIRTAMGLTFIVPVIPKKLYNQYDYIKEIIDELIKDKNNYTFWAYHVSEKFRDNHLNDGNYYPIVIMVSKAVKNR